MNNMLRIPEIEAQIALLPEFLSIKQVAEVLGLSYLTVWRLNKLSAFDMVGIKIKRHNWTWRIAKKSLLLYLTQNNTLNLPDVKENAYKKKSTAINVVLPELTMKLIKAEAKRTKTTTSSIVRFVLKKYFETEGNIA